MTEKVKFQMEFAIQVSPQMLYQYISTPSGLSEWYADDVNTNNGIYTFIWEDSTEKAKLVCKKLDEVIKFRWLEDEDNTFFEMKIIVDELTDDVSLIIVDFSEPQNLESAKMLWENQISELKHALGTI